VETPLEGVFGVQNAPPRQRDDKNKDAAKEGPAEGGKNLDDFPVSHNGQSI
jgi:hypothetical protein